MYRWYVLLTIWLCILHCNIFIVYMFMTCSTSYCLVTFKDIWNVYMYVCMYVFCLNLTTNNVHFPILYELTGSYNRDRGRFTAQYELNLLIKTQVSWRPCLTPGHLMWHLWWTKWQWGKFFSEYFGFLLYISFHHCSIQIFIYMFLPKGRTWEALLKYKSTFV